MRLRALIAMCILAPCLFAAPAPAQTVADLCDRGSPTIPPGAAVAAETIVYGGADRHFCTFTPSTFVAGAPHPLLVVLHGGDGNASLMMRDPIGMLAAAEAMGAIAIFPNGLPRDRCPDPLCLNNNWSAPDNVFFIAELIDRQKALGQVDENRVHLVGFSGGAKLIYEIVGTPGFPHAIHSVATVAGAFGLYHADRPEVGFWVAPLMDGSPVSALLVQGGLDPRLPAAGGLDETEREVHVSFRTKVDLWRLATGTERAAAQAINAQDFDAAAPAGVAALRYAAAGHTVVEVLDPGLDHAWPAWNVMAIAIELFER
jgi:poly(3-hydroxybutyrate) depolymerase